MKYVLISAVKGGVGKTLISLSIARSLAEMGEYVNFLDCDFSSSSFSQFVGKKYDVSSIELDTNDNFIPKLWQNAGQPIKAFAMSMISGNQKSVKVSGEAYKEIITSALLHTNWYYDAEVPQEPYMICDLSAGSSSDIISTLQNIIEQDKNNRLLGTIVISQNSQKDAFRKALELVIMDEEGNKLLGVIENMSSFKCEECEKTYEIFGKSETINIMQDVAMDFSIEEPEFLGKIPVSMEIAQRDSSEGIIPDVLPKEFLGTINKAVEIIQEAKPLKKPFKQKAKEKGEDLIILFAKTVGKLFNFANKKIDLGKIYDKFHYGNSARIHILDRKEKELFEPFHFRLTSDELIPIEDEEEIADFEVRMVFVTLARIVFGYMIHRPTGTRYPYTVMDAYSRDEIKFVQKEGLDVGSVNNLVKFFKQLFGDENLLRQVRSEMKMLEKFV